VYINSRHVLQSRNQFHSHTANVKPLLRAGENKLRVEFQSPVTFALNESLAYRARNKHTIPPDCWPEVYSGECHINQLRKIQASFSWDWGPSFPTVGIWQPIYLEYFDSPASIQQFSPLVQAEGSGDFLVNASALILCMGESSREFQATVSISELKLSVSKTVTVKCDGEDVDGEWVNVGELKVPKSSGVELWWPNGYGKQRLYNVTLKIGSDLEDKKVVGFRTVRLVQDLVDEKDKAKGNKM